MPAAGAMHNRHRHTHERHNDEESKQPNAAPEDCRQRMLTSVTNKTLFPSAAIPRNHGDEVHSASNHDGAINGTIESGKRCIEERTDATAAAAAAAATAAVAAALLGTAVVVVVVVATVDVAMKYECGATYARRLHAAQQAEDANGTPDAMTIECAISPVMIPARKVVGPCAEAGHTHDGGRRAQNDTNGGGGGGKYVPMSQRSIHH
jgi:hypothetical protein